MLFTLIFTVSATVPLQVVLGTPVVTARPCDPETRAGCPAGGGSPPREPIIRLTSFRPEVHGFHFPNNFTNEIPNIAVPGISQHVPLETKGRCGGMAYAALDYFFNGIPIPSRSDVPPDGDPLADYILTRLLHSFSVPTTAIYADWSFRASHDTLLRDGTRTLTMELGIPGIMRNIDSGRPVVVGLVGADIPNLDISQLRDIGDHNHQVVAYGYRHYPSRGVVEFLIYDNNYPDSEVVLTMDTQRSQITYSESTDRPWKGFFLHQYLGPMTPPNIQSQPDEEIRITSIQPDTIIAREPTIITVHAVDSVEGIPVDGEVIIEGVGQVGRTNEPFTFTFNTQSPVVIGTVRAQGYPDAQLTFRISFPQLEVRVEPDTIEINREAQVTIYALDPNTHAQVAGRVVTNEAITRTERPIFVGTTNEQLTRTFTPARGEPEVADLEVIGFHPAYPTVTVIAPGYSDTVVPINFTGGLPSELLPPLFRPRPTLDGSGEDNIS